MGRRRDVVPRKCLCPACFHRIGRGDRAHAGCDRRLGCADYQGLQVDGNGRIHGGRRHYLRRQLCGRLGNRFRSYNRYRSAERIVFRSDKHASLDAGQCRGWRFILLGTAHHIRHGLHAVRGRHCIQSRTETAGEHFLLGTILGVSQLFLAAPDLNDSEVLDSIPTGTTIDVFALPAPATLTLFGLGLMGLGLRGCRRFA